VKAVVQEPCLSARHCTRPPGRQPGQGLRAPRIGSCGMFGSDTAAVLDSRARPTRFRWPRSLWVSVASSPGRETPGISRRPALGPGSVGQGLSEASGQRLCAGPWPRFWQRVPGRSARHQGIHARTECCSWRTGSKYCWHQTPAQAHRQLR